MTVDDLTQDLATAGVQGRAYDFESLTGGPYTTESGANTATKENETCRTARPPRHRKSHARAGPTPSVFVV